MNGAECLSDLSKFTTSCSCPEGYEGDTCQNRGKGLRDIFAFFYFRFFFRVFFRYDIIQLLNYSYILANIYF
jgi:hypothetical protein